MRGSAAFRTGVAPGGALAGSWVRNPLWNAARSVPSLDLRFAENKSLVNATTGQNLVTFTRASSGTYVDSQGVIRTATTNLLLRSEEFDDSVWGKVGGSVTANAITAPNGQTTADLFTENTVLTQHDARVTSPTLTNGVTYTLTVYSKTNGRRLNIIYPLDTAGHGVTFDLINGTFTYTGNTVTATIQPVGNGWYRCSCTATKSGGSGTSQLRFLTHNGTTNNYTGDGTSGIYLWGAQLEQSSTVGEYIPTTSTIDSAPRFDHNPTTGESLGLLVEESRTNLLLRSEEFNDSTWTTSGLNLTTNAGAAPNGTTTAERVVPTITATGFKELQQNVSITSGTTYTFSQFVKADGYRYVQIIGSTAVFGGFSVNFDLQTGTETRFDASTSTVVGRGITSFGNGWYRIHASVTAYSTASGRITVNVIPSATSARGDSWSGDGTSGVLYWGAQLEAGSFPTSYIPTTTATVTRSADVASITGSNFSSWYRQDEGSFYAESLGQQIASGATGVIFGSDDGTGSNRIINAYTSTTANILRVVFDGTDQVNNSIGNITAGAVSRSIVAYRLNDFAGTTNGATPQLDSSGTVPTVTTARIGFNVAASSSANLVIRRLTYWPSRLPNSTLQQITQ